MTGLSMALIGATIAAIILFVAGEIHTRVTKRMSVFSLWTVPIAFFVIGLDVAHFSSADLLRLLGYVVMLTAAVLLCVTWQATMARWRKSKQDEKV